MQLAGNVLLVLAVAFLVVEVVALIRLAAQTRRLESTARELAARIQTLPPDLVKLLGAGDRQIISVELLNPFDLASRETWVARPLSAVTPNLLRDVVYKKAVAEVRAQMIALGVEADIRTHHVR